MTRPSYKLEEKTRSFVNVDAYGAWNEISNLLESFEVDHGAERAMVHALNRVAVGARAEIVRFIISTYEIRARDIRSGIKIRKANFRELDAMVWSTGYANELIDFKHSPTTFILPRPKIGVKIKVRKDRPGGVIPHAFLTKSAHHILIRRDPDKDQRLTRRLYGPAIPSMMNKALSDDEQQGILDRAEERLQKELEHEVDFMLKNGGPRI